MRSDHPERIRTTRYSTLLMRIYKKETAIRSTEIPEKKNTFPRNKKQTAQKDADSYRFTKCDEIAASST